MGIRYFYLFFLLINFSPVWSQQQEISKDSLIIKNFDQSFYKASGINYFSMIKGKNILYFGNENGLLEFDGSMWRLHNIQNFSSVVSADTASDDKIYITGINEFGYFDFSANGDINYHSLRHTVSEDSTLNELYQAKVINDDHIIFRTRDYFINWNQLESKIDPIKNAWLANLGDTLMVSAYSGIGYYNTDSIIYIDNELKFEDDAAFPFIKKPDGKYFAFTYNHGLYELDVDNNYSTKKLETELAKAVEKGFYNAEVWKDSLIVGLLEGEGVFFADFEGNIVKKIKKEDGLISNYPTDISIDKYNNLWISSWEGISYISWPIHHSQDSLPHVNIRLVQINDTLRSVKHLNLSKLEFLNNNLTFHFYTEGYINDQVSYSTLLEGFEDTWQDWASEPKRVFTNLSPGEYTFKVKSKNQFGVESDIAAFNFYIPTPWQKSWWFFSLMAILVGAIVFGFINYRTKQLKLANLKLENLVSQRTKEIEEQRKALEKANKELKITNSELDNFVYRSSHDLVAPLKSLRGLVQIAKLEKDSTTLETYHSLMEKSINKLEEFIKSIMDFSINSKRPLEKLDVTIDELVDNVVEDLVYYENVSKVKIIRDYKSGFSIKSDPKRLKIIFSNLITNSVKYHDFRQDDPYVKISAYDKGEHIEIKIVDNGQGIDQEHQEKIFDMFYRATEGSEGSGLGLYIVKDTIEMLDGEIKLHSKRREGTTFTILLPKN